MRVLVIANDAQRAELESQPVDGRLQLTYAAIDGDHAPVDACLDLLFENTPERLARLKALHCPLVVVNSVIDTLEETAAGFVRVNGWPGFIGRPLVEAAATDAALRQRAETLFSMLGRKTEWVPDKAGFISARVISSIINEAFFALEEEVSSEKEIDTAMKLGTNYPHGPFEWGEKLGWRNIYLLLSRLGHEQERYTPSSLLKQRALA